ncbi:hypothetical protein C8Q79DRAFT_928485 [Trametes meyenii]|nr:hypothetical protein C8Q79DRAFT_928485 [Trametes meyenii]
MSSPATVVDDSGAAVRMLTRLLVWYENRKPPASTYIDGLVGQEVTLHEVPWVRLQFDGAIHRVLDFWSANHTDWEPQCLSTVTIMVTVQTPAILIRVPGVIECVGLGQEIQLVEQALGYDQLPKLEMCDLRGEQEECDEVRAVVWDQAKEFALSLKMTSSLAIADYPHIMEHCTKTEAEAPLNEHVLERWDLRGAAWRGHSVGEAFFLDDNVKTVLIRHNENRQPLGFGYQLACAERACMAVGWTGTILKTDKAPILGDKESKPNSATEGSRKKRRMNGAPKAGVPSMSNDELRARTRVEDGHEYVDLT